MEAIQYLSFLENNQQQLSDTEKSSSYMVVSENYISVSHKKIDFNSSTEDHLDVLTDLLNGIEVTDGKIPSAILMNIPLDLKRFKVFYNSVKSINHFQKILFFWNSTILSVSEMLYLMEAGMADDFFEDVDDLEGIEKKICFLFKYKQSLHVPKLLPLEKTNLEHEGKKSFMLVKRVFDIAVSLVLLLFLTPLFILVAIAIKLESRGPVFYVSNRVGKHYKIFPMIKFRSMRDGADKYLNEISHLNIYGANEKVSSFVKIKDDPRVSNVGKFLRKTSIDEFPQLLNVLMGHMSIVGNRPLPLYEAERLLVNDYVKRFDAPAGITGLWQVVKKEKPDMDEEERIKLDIRYSNELNLVKDCWILLKTPSALLQNQNY
jgi:lipopolysaccharide/colanic/teichoic acid biosynthesis glycosyltransferase